MTKQQKLKDYRHVARQIRLLEEKLFEIETKARRTTASYGDGCGGKSGSSGDPLAESVASIVDLQEMLNAKVSTSYALLADVERTIESLPIAEQNLIRLRYVYGWRWEHIGLELGYTADYAKQIHNLVIKKLEK